MKEVKAPDRLINADRPFLFLAGSIEMGTADDWQSRAVKALEDIPGTVFNPRRTQWDPAWKDDDPRFVEQVNWELSGLDDADIVAFYFDPLTKSPISLLELGLCAHEKECFVYCPKGFWRKGNVNIVCERYAIGMAFDWNDFIRHLGRLVRLHG